MIDFMNLKTYILFLNSSKAVTEIDDNISFVLTLSPPD